MTPRFHSADLSPVRHAGAPLHDDAEGTHQRRQVAVSAMHMLRQPVDPDASLLLRCGAQPSAQKPRRPATQRQLNAPSVLEHALKHLLLDA